MVLFSFPSPFTCVSLVLHRGPHKCGVDPMRFNTHPGSEANFRLRGDGGDEKNVVKMCVFTEAVSH